MPVKSTPTLPKPAFLQDVLHTCKTPATVAYVTGLTKVEASKLLKGEPLPRARLNSAMLKFYKIGKGSDFELQVRSVQKGSRSYYVLVKCLRCAADFVVRYRDDLHVGARIRKYWVFPPKNTLNSLCNMVDECYRMLRQMHRDCPLFDRLVFKDHPELLEEIKRDRRNGSSGVFSRTVRKQMQRDNESRKSRPEKDDTTVQPADERCQEPRGGEVQN